MIFIESLKENDLYQIINNYLNEKDHEINLEGILI